MRTDIVAALSFALICVFVITLLTAYFFPIYSDEIEVRFWLSRLPYDFPEISSGLPACSATFLQHIGSTTYLPTFIDWVIHGSPESPSALRIVGIFIALLWVGGLASYLYVRAKDSLAQTENQFASNQPRLYIASFVISIFSIGVFPIFLITNRGEQLILPSVVLLIAIFIASTHLRLNEHCGKRIGLVVLYFVATSLILHTHPKGLFLTPFFIIVGWQVFSQFKSRLPFAFGMALLTLHIVQNFIAFRYAYQCAELPKFEAMMKSFSFDPLSLFYDPSRFFEQAYHSVLMFPKYLQQLGFQEQTDAAYLPSHSLTVAAKLANVFIKLNLVVAFFTLLVLLPYKLYREKIVAGRLVTVNLLLLVLLACALISAVFNLPKNWYDAGYLYALLLIILIFFIGENFPNLFQKPASRMFFIYLCAVALLSQLVFISRNLPSFLDGYEGPGVSIVKYDSINIRKELEVAIRECNIDPANATRIVVDDSTYWYFRKSRWPMPITYIWQLPDDKSIRQFFSTAGSDGLIVACDPIFTPLLKPYMPFVKRNGNICCIPKERLKNLSSLP